MKSFATLLSALLIVFSVSVFAADEPHKEAKKTTSAGNFPSFSWGGPEDINDSSIKELNKAIGFPEKSWGAPDDAVRVKGAALTIAFPALSFGDPGTPGAVNEKIDFPAMNWGNPSQIE